MFDVSKYRDDHEPEHQWELRRRFLELHKDTFDDEERLVGLARVLANVEFMGCRYPKQTMELVSSLASELVEDFRKEGNRAVQPIFVDATNAAKDKVNKTNDAIAVRKRRNDYYSNNNSNNNNNNNNEPDDDDGKEVHVVSEVKCEIVNKKRKQEKKKKKKKKKKTTTTTTMKDNVDGVSESEPGDVAVAMQSTSETMEKLTLVLDKTSDKEEAMEFTSTSVTVEVGKKKKRMKRRKKKKKKKNGQVVSEKSDQEETKSCQVMENASHEGDQNGSYVDLPKVDVSKDASESSLPSSFVLVRQQFGEHGPLYELDYSASVAKVECKIDFENKWANVRLNGQVLAKAKNDSKAQAKQQAAKMAVELLEKRYPTLLIKSRYVSHEDRIRASSLCNQRGRKNLDCNPNKHLPESNIGHKMLMAMGWKPGLGLGVDNKGRCMPITPTSLSQNRKTGLGHVDFKLRKRVRQVLEEYADVVKGNQLPTDLVFQGFDKETRAYMHEQVMRLRLQSRSYWERDEDGTRHRVFVACKKKSVANIVQELRLKEDGENDKYKLIEPTSISLDNTQEAS